MKLLLCKNYYEEGDIVNADNIVKMGITRRDEKVNHEDKTYWKIILYCKDDCQACFFSSEKRYEVSNVYYRLAFALSSEVDNVILVSEDPYIFEHYVSSNMKYGDIPKPNYLYVGERDEKITMWGVE